MSLRLIGIALTFILSILHAYDALAQETPTQSEGEVVCQEVESSVLGSIWSTIVSVGETILIDVPLTTGKVVVGVVAEVPSATVNTVKGAAEFVYSAAFIFTWWAGTPHPDLIFRPGSTQQDRN